MAIKTISKLNQNHFDIVLIRISKRYQNISKDIKTYQSAPLIGKVLIGAPAVFKVPSPIKTVSKPYQNF